VFERLLSVAALSIRQPVRFDWGEIILLLASSMLKQKEVAFLKAISAVRQSPALLRELRKALAASREKRAVAVRKAVDLPGRLHAGRRARGRPAKWAWVPPENLQRVDLLRRSPPGAARAPLLLRRDRLSRAARSHRDQRKPRWRPGELLCRKVNRLSLQPWSRTCPTQLPPRRHLTGACRKT
jgi:hypothetical protein